MRLKIESDREAIQITFAADTASKPVSQRFTRDELKAVAKLLETAAKCDDFVIDYQIGG